MNKQWWKEAVIYQIYPRSFNDTSGDGIGDISGIIDKLDYIKSLGVDVVWLCPIYESPNDDNGYDISDYYNIMTEFGTMADFDRMLAEMKKRDLKLLIIHRMNIPGLLNLGPLKTTPSGITIYGGKGRTGIPQITGRVILAATLGRMIPPQTSIIYTCSPKNNQT